jgi:hypothetical protein
MATNIHTGIGAALLKFTFSDEDGEVVASFKINPADVKLAVRCEEVAAYFEEKKNAAPETASLQDLAKYTEDLENKICYLLGYDAKESLFGLLSATTILPSGELFAFLILDKVAGAIAPEVAKRRQKMQKAAAKYTDKYTK